MSGNSDSRTRSTGDESVDVSSPDCRYDHSEPIKSVSQRAAAHKVLRAVERLLPKAPDATKEAYARGYTDGVAAERSKSWTRSPDKNE